MDAAAQRKASMIEQIAEHQRNPSAAKWRDLRELCCAPIGIASVLGGILAAPFIFIAWLISGCPKFELRN